MQQLSITFRDITFFQIIIERFHDAVIDQQRG